MWRHTVLEIYDLEGRGWPTEGEPAEWIEKRLVAWCQGEDETAILFTPFPLIVWWKLHWWAGRAYALLYNMWFSDRFPWGRKKSRELEAFFDSIPVVEDSLLPASTSEGSPSASPGGQGEHSHGG